MTASAQGNGYQLDGDLALTARVRALLLDEVDAVEIAGLPPDQRRARLERTVGDLLNRERRMLSARSRAQVIATVVDDAIGLGALEPLLADENVTEVMVNGPSQVLVERNGVIERSLVRFSDNDSLMRTIERIVSAANRRLDESSPMVDARLLTGERVNVIIPPLSLNGPVMTIRRFPRPFSLADLVRLGSVDQVVADLLAACVRSRWNILISGGTGSGKTTLLNVLSGFIGSGDRVVTIEDVAELALLGDHVIRLEARPPNAEGRGEVTIRSLVRNSLRMRPDRIIVGEVRGGETLDMLQAMNTGHDGSLTSVHANSALDALVRLETLASMAELSLPTATLRSTINSAVDLVVHVARFRDGRRGVVEVSRVTSRRHGDYELSVLARRVGVSSGATRFEVADADAVAQLVNDAGELVDRRITTATQR